jgi:sugar phosphate isomerase/epimerase
VYVACSSLCFSRYPLAHALHAISELNFHKVDLALHEGGPHLKPSDVLADVNRAAQLLRKGNVAFAAFHVEIEAPDAEKYKDTLRAVCRLGRNLAVPLVNIPAAPADSDFAAEVTRLTGLARLAQTEGVMLTVETHSKTLTNDPARAAELCRQVPGLGVTLDPSHYLVGAHPAQDYDDLFPHVRHVRLRDTAPDRLQVRVGQGQVEYGRIVSQLARAHYARALSVDIHDQPEPEYPMEPEVRKLKFLLESMV